MAIGSRLLGFGRGKRRFLTKAEEAETGLEAKLSHLLLFVGMAEVLSFSSYLKDPLWIRKYGAVKAVSKWKWKKRKIKLAGTAYSLPSETPKSNGSLFGLTRKGWLWWWWAHKHGIRMQSDFRPARQKRWLTSFDRRFDSSQRHLSEGRYKFCTHFFLLTSTEQTCKGQELSLAANNRQSTGYHLIIVDDFLPSHSHPNERFWAGFFARKLLYILGRMWK